LPSLPLSHQSRSLGQAQHLGILRDMSEMWGGSGGDFMNIYFVVIGVLVLAAILSIFVAYQDIKREQRKEGKK
jgi:hypothetical protein